VPQSIGGGLIFPGALDTNQVHDLFTNTGTEGSGSRWATSPAMEKVFLPNRMRILKEFLEIGKAPEHSN
jgi:hypothetical protein